jgi:predicted transcriptional regulator
MSLVQFARDYCTRRKIKPVPVYSTQRFAAVVGDLEPSQVTQEALERYAAKATDSVSTIRGTIKDVLTICKAAGVSGLHQFVRKPQPIPKPTPIDSIEKAWPFLAPWSCQLVVILYWTGLRLDDAIELQIRGIDLDSDAIRWQASKTGKNHCWPLTRWMRPFLKPVGKLPFSVSNDHAQVIVRGELQRVSELGGVSRIMPQQMRQRSVQEWTRANATAGAIVHGMGLGVMSHYLDPLMVLESASSRVRLPACFGGQQSQSTEDALISSFRRLDPSAQGLVSMTAERLAAS